MHMWVKIDEWDSVTGGSLTCFAEGQNYRSTVILKSNLEK